MKKFILALSIPLLSITSSAQVTTGLVVDYSFNNGTANDNMGVSNGTVSGAALTNDRFGNSNKAYNFNGVAYIDCGKPSAINSLNSALSVSAWFKRASFSTQYEVIAAKWDYTPVSEHFFLATQNNKIVWACPGPGNSGTADTTKLQANSWVHVVYCWTSTGQVKLYVNGVLSSSALLAAHTPSITTPVNMMIGAQNSSTRLFNGSIDDVKIYNRVLTASEVTSLYNETNPSTVGIREQIASNKSLSVYPNPSGEKFTVSSPDDSEIKIINEFGQLLQSIKLNAENDHKAEVSGLPAGVYTMVSVGRIPKKVVVTR